MVGFCSKCMVHSKLELTLLVTLQVRRGGFLLD
jgi:hypothetical protein